MIRSVLSVQGEVQVLIETGELFTFCGVGPFSDCHSHFFIIFGCVVEPCKCDGCICGGIRLCYNIEDEATEAIMVSS